MQFKNELITVLAEESGLEESVFTPLMEIPPQPEMGDLALPCFRLAKEMRKAPALIAEDLKTKIEGKLPWLKKLDVVGGYLNFFYDPALYATAILRQSREEGFSPGSGIEGNGKTVLVEYSSPNIAKPFHVGHAFSTLVGEAIANLYEYRGYKVMRLNHLGDYGTQFGKLITAWKHWGDEKALAEDPITELNRVYVKFHQELAEHPELEDEGRRYFRLLEEKAPEEYALWELFREVSLEAFAKIYRRLNIEFDNMNGESFYSDQIPAVVDLLREKNLLVESEGAQVVDLEKYNLNPCLILKSDGATIYASRDIAAVYYRDREWDFYRNIYVVGLPQKNHFQQVFAVLKEAGFAKADQCIHVPFGTVRFADVAFSTRQGNVILLDDLLAESVSKTREIILANNPDMADSEVDRIAESVGVGAVRYTFLRNGRERDIIFSWDDMLDFEGDSAPYLQYTFARCSSIMRLAEADKIWPLDQVDLEAAGKLLTGQEEQAIFKLAAGFETAVLEALNAHEPSIMLRNISQLARAFNRFYHSSSILHADNEEIIKARLLLTETCRIYLQAGLQLAGIDVLDRM
ncbi:MAG TPA: arginine--tRNA ligase [Clostridiaceae bacterium]|nr:arginine--tRNA ligase [Clostridiaceae bacterium]